MIDAADARAITRCRYCAGSSLTDVISLGDQPPSNAFIPESAISVEMRYPLEVVLCETCRLVQLAHTVDPHVLFDEYLYVSGSSGALRRQLGELAATISKRSRLAAGDLVVDVGCNDGTLLDSYDSSLRRVGVEPSQLADLARHDGIDVYRTYFSTKAAQDILQRHGPAKVITATNVYPHVDAIDDFTEAFANLLGPDGTLVIEASYLPALIDQVLYDTVYHEHLCYLSLTPLIPFVRGHGLTVVSVDRLPTGASGPSIRVWMKRSDSDARPDHSVLEMTTWEEQWGVHKPDPYTAFSARVATTRSDLLALMERLTGASPIGGYGAPAKGNTLLNYVGLDRTHISMIADTNPLKHGLVTPGTHIPIVSEELFLTKAPPYALLLAWNYLDFFLKNSSYRKQGGRFIVPLPTPTIV